MRLFVKHLFLLAILVLAYGSGVSSVLAGEKLDSALVTLIANHNDSRIQCKGVAISTKTILTAAHCVALFEPGEIDVMTSLGNDVGVKAIKIHPQFNPQPRIPHYDMALLSTYGKVTDSPLPVIISSGLDSGDKFAMIGSKEANHHVDNAQDTGREMIVADIERALLNYIQIRRGSFPHPALVSDLEQRIKSGDPRIRQKIFDEFGDFIFSLYSESKNSFCQGDSGSPAVVIKNGSPGVVGLATAVGRLEADQNTGCSAGDTSIFTSVNQTETVQFLRKVDPEIVFK